MIEFFIFIGLGIILIIFGLFIKKYPEKYLEIFGARILILFQKEKRIKAMRLIGFFLAILGIITAFIGLVKFFQ